MGVVKSNKGRIIAEIHFLTDNKIIKNKEVKEIIKKSLLICYKVIPAYDKKVAIYSSTDKFVKNKMGGVGADALQENVISLYINPVRGWKKELVNSIAHEYSHLTVLDVRKWNTVLDSLIIEGIAENFREEVFGGKRTPWTKSLTEKEAKSLIEKLRKNFRLKAEKMHSDLFFGSKEFKMWSGYSLGYYIVKKFRENNSDFKWKQIVRLKSSDVLKKSRF